MCIKQLETLIKLNYKNNYYEIYVFEKLYFVKFNYFTLKLNFKKTIIFNSF